MTTLRTSALAVVVLFTGILGFATPASATIHPIVESAECANAQADAQHPLGDVADPIGATPGAGSHSDTSSLRALKVITDDFNDFSSPALSDHKGDGKCGKVGQE